jgi:hypothetical protein
MSDEDEGPQVSFAFYEEEPSSVFTIFTTTTYTISMYEETMSAEAIRGKREIKMLGKKAISYPSQSELRDSFGTVVYLNNNKEIFFEKDKTLFHFEMDNITDNNEKIFEDILSSFRFLSESEECHEIDKPFTVVLEDKIFYYGQEIGTFADGKIIIPFGGEGEKYSFPGNPQKLSLLFGYPVYDDTLIIAEPRALSLSQKPEMTYDCSGPLKPPSPYFYCETNGKNYLEQYEFGPGMGFGTGGGDTLFWHKMYLKNIDGRDIVFAGALTGDTFFTDLPEDDPFMPAMQKEKERLQSRKYLDEIIQNTANKEKERIWNGVVHSFSLEKE